jgi:hypothetical protein
MPMYVPVRLAGDVDDACATWCPLEQLEQLVGQVEVACMRT